MDLLRGRINERLPKWEVHYGSVELALPRMAKGNFLFVIDLQNSFLNWLVCEEDSNLLGFYSPSRNQYGRFRFFPFGLSTAPAANDDSLKEILRLLHLNTGIQLTDFVDDMIGGDATEEEAWAKVERVVKLFLSVCIPVSDKPTGVKRPSQRQQWVGWIFDTVACLIAVDENKCVDCIKKWIAVLELDDRRELRARTLASAAGLASHIGYFFLQGRRRLHHIWADLNKAQVYSIWSTRPGADPLVSLSEQSRFHISWWIRALETPPSRPLHGAGGALSAWGPKSLEFADWPRLAASGVIKVIETDASKLIGWSYHLCGAGRVVSGT